MSAPRNKQDLQAARDAARVTTRIEWRASEHWGDRSKLKAGVNWLRHDVSPTCVIYDPVTGICIEIQPSGVAVAPPRADYEREARIALEQAKETKREAVILTSRLVAERAERERIEEIEQRYADGGLSAVTLDEAKAVALYRRGPEYVEQTEQQARERQQQNPTNEETQS